MNSRLARPARTPGSGRCAIRTIRHARPAARAADRRSRSRPACRSAPIGTDTGGSIRIPAAACGIVGLKPEWGHISASGVVPLSRQLDHVGPLAASVADAWLLYNALHKHSEQVGDALDAAAARRDCASAGSPATCPIDSTPTSSTACARRSRCCSSAARPWWMSRCRTPNDMAAIYLHLVFGDAAEYHARTLVSRPQDYTTPVRLRLEMARYVLAEDYIRALRGKALIAQRSRSRARWRGCAGAAVARHSRAAAWRGDHAGQGRPRGGAHADAALHAAVQPVGTSRDLAAVRPHAATACRSACSWSATRDARRRWSRRRSQRKWRSPKHRDSRLFPSLGAGARGGQQEREAGSPVRVGRGLDRSRSGSAIGNAQIPDPRSLIPIPGLDMGRRDHARHRRVLHAGARALHLHESAGHRCARRAKKACVTFASGYATPHPENNTVVCRYFAAEPDLETQARSTAPRGRRAGAMELRRRRPHRPLQDPSEARHRVAAHQPAVSRRAHAARTDARRLHRQLEHRPHAAGVPAGGARCAARAVVAARSGLRAARAARHQPRVVPVVSHDLPRAAGAGAGPESRLAVFRRRGVAGPVDRARARRASRVTSTSISCASCGARSARGRSSIGCTTRRR